MKDSQEDVFPLVPKPRMIDLHIICSFSFNAHRRRDAGMTAVTSKQELTASEVVGR